MGEVLKTATEADIQGLIAERSRLLASVAIADTNANARLLEGALPGVQDREKAVDLRMIEGITNVLVRHGIDVDTLDAAVA